MKYHHRENVTVGLQEGDTCKIITPDKREIYAKAIITRGGYVRLEVNMPIGSWANRVAKSDEDQLTEDN